MTEGGGAVLTIIAALLAVGVAGGALLGYFARRAGRSPGRIGWLAVATLVVALAILPAVVPTPPVSARAATGNSPAVEQKSDEGPSVHRVAPDWGAAWVNERPGERPRRPL